MEDGQALGAASDGQEPQRPAAPGLHVQRWLGSGAAASVWLVRDALTGTEYALKVLSAQPAPSSDDAGGPPPGRRPARHVLAAGEGEPAPWAVAAEGQPGTPAAAAADHELALLAGARHEHLLPIHGQVATDRGPGLLLEYAAGGSLAALVAARGPLAVGEAVTILTPVAQVLAYLHGTGTVHGDVSPGNVLFTAVGKPLLADLGVARALGSDRPPAAGTPGFGAPRSGSRGGPLDPEADIYALAAIGWFALTGRVPGATAQRPPLAALVPEVPDDLVDLLEDGLAERAGERPSAAEFARRAIRAAQPEALDLTASAHPSVASQLLTRRQAAGKAAGRRDRGVRPRFPRAQAGAARGGDARPIPGRRAKAALAVTAAAAAGILFALAGAVTPAPPNDPDAGRSPGRGQSVQQASTAQREGRPPAPPEARVLPAELERALRGDDAAAAVPALAWLRTEAVRTRDAALLNRVNVPGTALMDADRGIIAALAGSGSWLDGLDTTVEEVTAEPASRGGGPQERVAATVSTSGYRQVAADGSVLGRRAAPSVQRVQLEMVRRNAGWLIQAVREAPRRSDDPGARAGRD